MAYADTIISCRLWELYDNRNLMAIFKDELINEYNTTEIKARLISEYNELNNVLEVYFNSYRVQTGAGAVPVLYIETIDFKQGQGRAHWYVDTIDIRDDGTTLFNIKRDTLRDFYSFYSSDSVLVKTESKPLNAKNTQYTGQAIHYTEIKLNAVLETMFPYMYGNSTDWRSQPLLAVDIVSNRAQPNKSTLSLFPDGNIGKSSYMFSFNEFATALNRITTPSILEQITSLVEGSTVTDLFSRVQIAPFMLQGSALDVGEDGISYIPISKSFNLTINAGTEKEPAPSPTVKYLTRKLLYSAPAGSNQTGNGYTKFGSRDITVTYNTGEVERIELDLPFIGKVDVSGYMEYFNGLFKIQFIVDTITGNGIVGLTANKTANIIAGIDPEYVLTIPFNCYRDINWIVTNTNIVNQAFGAITSIAGAMSSGSALAGATGAVGSLLKGNTQISQHAGNVSTEHYARLLAGEHYNYCVRLTKRRKGVTNTGFKYELQAFNTLTPEATTAQPTADYNIITVDIARRAWTGDTEIDNDIYTRLTQGGFVFNG